jgi:hypothetical protein
MKNKINDEGYWVDKKFTEEDKNRITKEMLSSLDELLSE